MKTLWKARLIAALAAVTGALALFVLTRSGLWANWGFDVAQGYGALGILGMSYFAAIFVIRLLEEREKNKESDIDRVQDKEGHDGI